MWPLLNGCLSLHTISFFAYEIFPTSRPCFFQYAAAFIIVSLVVFDALQMMILGGVSHVLLTFNSSFACANDVVISKIDSADIFPHGEGGGGSCENEMAEDREI